MSYDRVSWSIKSKPDVSISIERVGSQLRSIALKCLLSVCGLYIGSLLSVNEEGVTERKDTKNEDTDSGAMMT
jgi:hypothetical protein